MASESKSAIARRLGVSRSSLYYKSKKPDKDERLRVQIEEILINNPGYGHRRISQSLGANKKRILRVMNMFNLRPSRRCKTPQKPSDIAQKELNFPCITKTQCPIVPNYIWVSDFTFISYKGSFVFLSTILDLYTKEVIGFDVKCNHSVELIYDAFSMAIKNQKVLPAYLHSDQGSEYRCLSRLLIKNGIQVSMSPKASPFYNGSQESFFGRFKVEFGDPDRFDSFEELTEAICLHIHYYNNHRIHSRLKMSPVKFRNLKSLSITQEFRTQLILTKSPEFLFNKRGT
mgnify:CR=1 FL=1